MFPCNKDIYFYWLNKFVRNILQLIFLYVSIALHKNEIDMKVIRVNEAGEFDSVEEQQTLEFDIDVQIGSSEFAIIGDVDVKQTPDLDGVYVDKFINELNWTIYNEDGVKINDFNIDLNYESVEIAVREACKV